MPADIARTVIFDETVPAMPEIMEESRTIITAGDDGFLNIEQIEGEFPEGSRDEIGLTPPMIAAIVKWANARAAA